MLPGNPEADLQELTIKHPMHTDKRNEMKALMMILTLAITPFVIQAQYHEPTYDRKPVDYYTDLQEGDQAINTFEVYPNQTDGELNIVMDDFVGQPVEILIQDKSGKTVLHQRIDRLQVGFQGLDLNDYDLANGKYKVSVLNNGQSFNAETIFTRKK